jgi:hypothetical protein
MWSDSSIQNVANSLENGKAMVNPAKNYVGLTICY